MFPGFVSELLQRFLPLSRLAVPPMLPGFVSELLQRFLPLSPLQHQSPTVQVSAVDETLEGGLGVADVNEVDESKAPMVSSSRHLSREPNGRQLSESSEQLR